MPLHGQELKVRVQRQTAVATGLFQGDITIRTLLDSLAEGVVIIYNSGSILLVNAPAEQLFGYPEDELIGKHFSCFFTEEERKAGKPEEELKKAATTGRHEEKGWRIRKDGSRFWAEVICTALFDESGNLLGFSKVTHDISEQKRAVEALQESEEKFYTIFDTVPVGITISTMDDGRFVDINNEGVRLSGYSRDEVIGRTATEFNVWKDPFERAQVFEELQKQGAVSNREMEYLDKKGHVLWGLYSAVIIDIRGKQHLLSIVSDITERKQAAEMISRLAVSMAERSADLAEANRNLEAFNYTVAHDLRNPLNLIFISCQAIKELFGEQLPEECLEYLQDIYDSVSGMNYLIHALFNFSRIGHVEPCREQVHLSEMAQEVVRKLKQCEPERQVDFHITDKIVADGDAGLLLIVLDNLLGNAWKYTGLQEKAVIQFNITDIDGTPVYFVRDNGAGFDKADAGKLFVPFQRLPGAEKFKGSGIGLATVERIIGLHGGRIWAEGVPGKGACFCFTLSEAP